MHNDIKLRIAAQVAKWEAANPTEFSLFLQGRKAKTDDLRNRFAELKGHDYLIRLLYEIPESLDAELRLNLTPDDMAFLRSDVGGKWFARTFKQYNVSQRS